MPGILVIVCCVADSAAKPVDVSLGATRLLQHTVVVQYTCTLL